MPLFLCNLQDRIEIIDSSIEQRSDLLATADIIVLNNVFEFFMDPKEQAKMWKLIHEHVKKKALLVTCPALDVTMESLPVSSLPRIFHLLLLPNCQLIFHV